MFRLDDNNLKNLAKIFTEYKNLTEIYIDKYKDTKRTIENKEMQIKIIDTHIEKSNMNINKQKIVAILEFRTLLNNFSVKTEKLKY